LAEPDEQEVADSESDDYDSNFQDAEDLDITGEDDNSIDSDEFHDTDEIADSDDNDEINPLGCPEITLKTEIKPTEYYSYIYGARTLPLGDVGNDRDVVQIHFVGVQNIGEYDLGSEQNSNFSTFRQAVYVYEDVVISQPLDPEHDGPTKTYFQKDGKMVIEDLVPDEITGEMTSQSKVTLSNITLVEVTIDKSTKVSTPVEGGSCLFLKSASWDSME